MGFNLGFKGLKTLSTRIMGTAALYRNENYTSKCSLWEIFLVVEIIGGELNAFCY